MTRFYAFHSDWNSGTFGGDLLTQSHTHNLEKKLMEMAEVNVARVLLVALKIPDNSSGSKVDPKASFGGVLKVGQRANGVVCKWGWTDLTGF